MDGLGMSAPVMNWEAPDLEAAWKTFMEHATFVFNGPLKKKSEEEKCAYLMIWVGEKGRKIYQTWTMTEENKKSLKIYTDNFEKYVKPRSNIVYNRYKFSSRIQNEVCMTSAGEYCYYNGAFVRYCDDGSYCCDNGTVCCTEFTVATIIGIVFGCIAVLACCVAVAIIFFKKKKRSGVVVSHSSGPVAPITVASIQHQYNHQPTPQGFNHYGQPHGPSVAPPYGQPSNLPPPYSQSMDPVYPPPPPRY